MDYYCFFYRNEKEENIILQKIKKSKKLKKSYVGKKNIIKIKIKN